MSGRNIYEKHAYFSHLEEAPIELQEEEEYFLHIYENHFKSDKVTYHEPVCFVTAGVMRTLIEWITGHLPPHRRN